MNWLTKISMQHFPLAGNIVDGRQVRSGTIPNQDSIPASFNDYEILKGIREVPMSSFTLDGDPQGLLVKDQWTISLAKEIQKTNEIMPLIVAVDNKGPYILEGGHRFDALKLLKAKSFPALVVLDLDDQEENNELAN